MHFGLWPVWAVLGISLLCKPSCSVITFKWGISLLNSSASNCLGRVHSGTRGRKWLGGGPGPPAPALAPKGRTQERTCNPGRGQGHISVFFFLEYKGVFLWCPFHSCCLWIDAFLTLPQDSFTFYRVGVFITWVLLTVSRCPLAF